ncbi:thiamine biosynthesis protein ThiI [Methanomicrobium sp. W14]|uniref:tRNA uracil 4-sulfurtransferase ThiI n=1 Tax=Methanomicrobium sp. W14 TaxID=2817839 RepID=UPI001AE20C27|nr:tRNA uracil 4-sulfurtransferase ThiI [Methanomicrobium sp. W14]MBP2132479.1 thiamine biosynthesis protein ThiI [Methanomicrobium sp. W14]
MTTTVMAKYGELFLKSDSVMHYYTKLLAKNIKTALNAAGLKGDIEIHRGRMLINGERPEEIAEVVSKIFGIVGVSIALRTSNDRDEIEKKAAEYASGKLKPGMSFAVRAKRSNLKGFTSQELGASAGSRIYDRITGLSVDLTKPDYEIFVEARKEGGLIYDCSIKGPGGLPMGTQGKVLSLISAGIDSPVASWLAMKRGCTVSFIHFNGGRYMGKDTLKAALENMASLSLWTRGQYLEMYSVNTERFYDALTGIENIRNRCLVCKRFMLKAAAEIVRREGYYAIVMGNNIGQVASQTLVNLGIVESVLPHDIPVIQPLITYDKDETVKIARKIGTFREFAGDVGCSVVPKHPAVSADIESVLNDEEEIDIPGLVKECLFDTVKYRAINGKIKE